MAHQLNGWETRGKREMQQLAGSAFDAVQEGELHEIFETLHVRVFDRPPHELLDVELVDGVCEWRFKPMVELLLLHVVDTAANRAVPAREREDEILRAVELVGF